jgi:hypothetical protein
MTTSNRVRLDINVKTDAPSPSDHQRFTSARRARRDASYSNLTPGVETVALPHEGGEATIVAVFDAKGRFLAGTVAERGMNDEGARAATSVTDLDDVLRWIEQ